MAFMWVFTGLATSMVIVMMVIFDRACRDINVKKKRKKHKILKWVKKFVKKRILSEIYCKWFKKNDSVGRKRNRRSS